MTRLLGNGRYVLGPQLGAGGMGVVYAAEDLARTERVAIKVAHAEHVRADLVVEHMARELHVGRATHHPNVVGVLDGGIDAHRSFVVMELAAGCTLSELAARDRLSIRRVATIVDQILAGLAAIHAAGFVHGDVKTDNVLVTRADDGTDAVKIIDLGLACAQGVEAPATDDECVISGTPHYLAPELVLGGVKTVASDVYAVGVILYELLTGTLPFAGDGLLEILRKQIEDDVVPPSLRAPQLKLSLELERVVLRALHKQPGERYGNADELRAALRTAAAASPDAVIERHAFSTVAPTVEWTRPELPRPRARGTNPPAGRRGDPSMLVEAALDATRTLLAEHRLSAVRDELESALRMIEGDDAGERMAWRLLLPLSAVCDALRDPCRARRLARLALDGASRAGSDEGRRRAKALIERLAGRSRRCA